MHACIRVACMFGVLGDKLVSCPLVGRLSEGCRKASGWLWSLRAVLVISGQFVFMINYRQILVISDEGGQISYFKAAAATAATAATAGTHSSCSSHTHQPHTTAITAATAGPLFGKLATGPQVG